MNYCNQVPKSIVTAVKRIIVIGDIHGSWKAITEALTLAGVIGRSSTGKWKWIGGDTHVVQVGDILDRGGRSATQGDEKSEYKIINFMIRMKRHAIKRGGDIHLILGNHEIMNVMGKFTYVSPMGMTDFDGKRKEMLAPGGKVSKELACNTNSVVKIGSWIFSHAGILPNVTKRLGINQVNTKIRQFLLGNTTLNRDDEVVDMFWHRAYAGIADCSKLDSALNDYSSKYSVIGHSVQSNGINQTCSGALWRVDVGMSDAFGSRNKKIQVLEILDDGARTNILTL